MIMTATELRANLYRTLDRVLETGEPVEINRNGRIVRLVAASRSAVFHLDQLVAHPGTLRCDPDDIVHSDWSDQWRP
jgi:prevent-host-death family protein